MIALITTAFASQAPSLDPATVPSSATGHGPQSNGKEHPVVARLLVDRQGLKPGETARVGIHLQQEEGWHTYWKTPGEIGLPTEITWSLPAGMSASDAHQPVPERFDQDGQVSYGYDGSVLHVAELTVPADAKPGTATLAADVSWLVCKTSCIPGSTHVELPVQVGAAADPSVHAPLFDWWSKRWPTPSGDVKDLVITPMLSVSGVRPDSTFRAAVIVGRADGKPLEGVDLGKSWPLFTPITSGFDWSVDSTSLRQLPDGRVAAVMEATAYAPDPLPTTDRIGGLVQVKLGDATVATEVT
ncbi:MAG: hypothetical protein KC621_29540, partial [Myxococcales bacterium]|nr:hypothetical protein [Myxococcales bacterium]